MSSSKNFLETQNLITRNDGKGLFKLRQFEENMRQNVRFYYFKSTYFAS